MSSAKTGTSKGFRGSTSYYCYSHVPRMRWTKVLDNPVDTAPTLWVNHTLFTVKSLNMVHIEGFVTVCSACGFVQTIWPYTIPIVWRFSLKNPLGFPGRQVSPPRSARIGLKKNWAPLPMWGFLAIQRAGALGSMIKKLLVAKVLLVEPPCCQ